VIAAGGGIVAEAATFERLLGACLTVWVKAAPELHMQRVIDQGDLRPMRDNRRSMDDLRAILASREGCTPGGLQWRRRDDGDRGAGRAGGRGWG